MPVVDDEGRVRGIVSEADLLAKMALVHEVGTPRPSRREIGPDARSRGRAEDAGGLMTAPAVTVAADDPVVTAARLVTRRGSAAFPSSTAWAAWWASSPARTCSGCFGAMTSRSGPTW